MRWRTYILAYLAYMAIHIMKMSFPFVQEFLIISYHTDTIFLGTSSHI